MRVNKFLKILLCLVLCISILLGSFSYCFASGGVLSFPLLQLPSLSSATVTAAGSVGALVLAAGLGLYIGAELMPTVINYIRGNMNPAQLENIEAFGNGTASINASTAATANQLVNQAIASGIPSGFGTAGEFIYNTADIPIINNPDLTINNTVADNLHFINSGLAYISFCPIRFYYQGYTNTYLGLLIYDSLNKNIQISQLASSSNAGDPNFFATNSFKFYTSEINSGNRVLVVPQYLNNNTFTNINPTGLASTALGASLLAHWGTFIPGVGSFLTSNTLTTYYFDNATNRQYYENQINTFAPSLAGTGSVAIPGTPTAEDDEEADKVPFILPPFSLDDSGVQTKVDFTSIPDTDTLNPTNTTQEPDNPDDGDDKDPISIVGLIDKLLDTLGTIVAFLTAYTMFQALCSILPTPIATLIWAAWLAFILFMLLRLILGR